MHSRFLKLALAATTSAFVACAVAACSVDSSPSSSPSSTSSPAIQPTTQAPAEPETAAGAQAAAQTIFELYGGGQFAAVWQDTIPSVRSLLSESTFVSVHQQCDSAGRSYKITDPVLAGNTAVVQVSLTGVLSSVGSEPQSLEYVGGEWLWSPSALDVAAYKAGSVSAIVAAEKSQGACQ